MAVLDSESNRDFTEVRREAFTIFELVEPMISHPNGWLYSVLHSVNDAWLKSAICSDDHFLKLFCGNRSTDQITLNLVAALAH